MGRQALLLNMRMRQLSVLAAALAFFAFASAVRAAEAGPEGVEFFEKKIRPVFLEQCGKCHGADKHKGNLQLTSRVSLLKGGDRGPAIVSGQPEQSLLIKAL